MVASHITKSDKENMDVFIIAYQEVIEKIFKLIIQNKRMDDNSLKFYSIFGTISDVICIRNRLILSLNI